MKKYAWMILGAALLMGCGGGADSAASESPASAAPTEAPAEESFLSIKVPQALDKALDGKLVEMEGYMQLPSTIYTDGKSGRVNFSERPFQRQGDMVSVSLTMGNCKYCMASLGESYNLEDLKVQAAEGVEVRANQRVKVSGSLSVYESSSSTTGFSASLTPSTITKVPEVELDYSTFNAVKLGKENIMDTTVQNVLCVVEGKLTIPSMLFMESDVSLDMNVGGQNLAINLLFGSGPNQIDNIPSNYTNADFKIHDYKGDLIKLNKPVKIYGTRAFMRKDYAGTLYVERIEQ